MFEKIGQIAEQVATNVSRRQFLGRLGQVALGAAGALGGLHVLSGGAWGDRGSPNANRKNCIYTCPDGSTLGLNCVQNCPPRLNGCKKTGQTNADCPTGP